MITYIKMRYYIRDLNGLKKALKIKAIEEEKGVVELLKEYGITTQHLFGENRKYYTKKVMRILEKILPREELKEYIEIDEILPKEYLEEIKDKLGSKQLYYHYKRNGLPKHIYLKYKNKENDSKESK